eukprot:3279655-Amphidinium_carterae.1
MERHCASAWRRVRALSGSVWEIKFLNGVAGPSYLQLRHDLHNASWSVACPLWVCKGLNQFN